MIKIKELMDSKSMMTPEEYLGYNFVGSYNYTCENSGNENISSSVINSKTIGIRSLIR
jgi:isocitrate lyase